MKKALLFLGFMFLVLLFLSIQGFHKVQSNNAELTRIASIPTEDPIIFVKAKKVWSETPYKSVDHYFVADNNVGYFVPDARNWGLLEVGKCYKVEQLYHQKVVGNVYPVSCEQ